MPDLGEGLTDGAVVAWFVAAGQHVEHGDPLAEIETVKITTELPSPVTGRVAQLHAREGQSIAVGAPLVTFELAAQPGIVGTIPPPGRPQRRVRLSRRGAGPATRGS
jgi:pyruvate dehydrogenase E2 component (dihydrolipoamide acetyltransferase)